MDGFASYYGQTALHPVAVMAVILLSLAAFMLPRRLALSALFISATTAPMAQRVVIAGADLTLMRLLLVVYLIRILARQEYREFKWNRLDVFVLMWTACGSVIMIIHFSTFGAVINRLGWTYDIVLTYFLTRCLIQGWDDIVALARVVAVVSVPIALAFAYEWATRQNMFAVFGGVPAVTPIREGRLRCQGPFSHPILAGTFWASCVPIIWMLWGKGTNARRLCVIGTVASLVIIACCSSSTPIVSFLIGLVGTCLFWARRRRRAMWVSALATIALLHYVVMDNPVWHLLARANIVGGSTGWHRFVIFDAFINHFDKWYLTGDANPLRWGVWQMRDITNQYILEGLNGGVLSLLAFLLVLAIAFANVGSLIARLSGASLSDKNNREWIAWLAGVVVLVHVVTFFGVSYFGQMVTIFYIQLGIVGALGTFGRDWHDSRSKSQQVVASQFTTRVQV